MGGDENLCFSTLDPHLVYMPRKIELLHYQKEMSELSVHDVRYGFSASRKNTPRSIEQVFLHFQRHFRNVLDQFLTFWNTVFRWRVIESQGVSGHPGGLPCVVQGRCTLVCCIKIIKSWFTRIFEEISVHSLISFWHSRFGIFVGWFQASGGARGPRLQSFRVHQHHKDRKQPLSVLE